MARRTQQEIVQLAQSFLDAVHRTNEASDALALATRTLAERQGQQRQALAQLAALPVARGSMRAIACNNGRTVVLTLTTDPLAATTPEGAAAAAAPDHVRVSIATADGVQEEHVVAVPRD